MAAAIVPEIAADAPITGASCPPKANRCAMAPAAAVTQKKIKKRAVPKRRATAEPKARNQIALTPRCVQLACRNA